MAQTKNHTRRNRKLLIAIIFLILSIFLLLAVYFLGSWIVLDRVNLPIYLEIGNKTGLKLDDKNLDFGRITYLSAAKKTVDIRSTFGFPIKVYFECTGNVCQYLNFEDVILLTPYENKTAVFTTIEFSSEPYGQYFGEMKVTFMRDII